MRTRAAVGTVSTALLLLVLAGCGSERTPVAVDPGGTPSSSAPGSAVPADDPAPTPTAVPPAVGTVATRDLVTVMDTGRPELCLGAVAESFPPQCGGPRIVGWDWERHGQGMFEQQGDVRWGSYALTGRWDGTAFEVVEAVPAALYDAVSPEPEPPLPEPATSYTDAELTGIAEQVGTLPGAQGAYVDGDHVLVDVVHDDGSLQAWADGTHGTGVVVVRSLLVGRPAR